MRHLDEDQEKTRHTIHLYKNDYAELQEAYRDLGAAVVIRRLVRKHLDDLRSKSQAKVNVELSA